MIGLKINHGPGGLFVEGPEKVSHPKSHRKILKLMIAEVFYSQYILGSLQYKVRFRRILYPSPFLHTAELKMNLRTRNVSRAIENRPLGFSVVFYVHNPPKIVVFFDLALRC